MGKTVFDTSSSKHATVTEEGLVTFTSPGEATVRVNPSSGLYAAFTDTITFTILDPNDLPVTDFAIAGETTVSEGETQLDLDGFKVIANYLNAPSEEVSDYTVSTDDSDPTFLTLSRT